jgi:thymidylate kinase
LLVGKLSPRPDLVVILDATPSELMARKAEHTIETLERQRRAYLGLADELRERVAVEVVDAGQDAASVHRQITTLLWDLFARRRQL